jgi:hypothetical protein
MTPARHSHSKPVPAPSSVPCPAAGLPPMPTTGPVTAFFSALASSKSLFLSAIFSSRVAWCSFQQASSADDQEEIPVGAADGARAMQRGNERQEGCANTTPLCSQCGGGHAHDASHP